jgi:hypothetical protein
MDSGCRWLIDDRRSGGFFISIDAILHPRHITRMTWKVETSAEFDTWWTALDDRSQDSLATVILLLGRDGPTLPRPYADKLKGSRIDLRELRATVYDNRNEAHVYRVLYAFDPKRQAFLCLGGDKANDGRWYERNIRRAERIYEAHLEALEKEEEADRHGR